MSTSATTPDRRALVQQMLRRKGIDRPADAGIPRRLRFSPCELSFAQQRLWLMDQLKPLSAAYNIPVRFRLQGALDVAAVRVTFNQLIARHESLRTQFGTVDGEPRQIVHESLRADVPLIDVTPLPADRRDAAARRLARKDAATTFDLRTAPLLRITLVRLAPDDHAVLFTMHHIVSDGWSMGVVVREFSALYLAQAAGRSAGMPPLEVQYPDFAVWQRGRFRGEAFDRLVAQWKARLADLPGTQVPADRPRPARRTGRGGSELLTLSPRAVDGLRALSDREGLTLFATCVAAMSVWLHRYSGQRDLAIGIPIANRLRSELEGLIGFFVNQLVLRMKIDGALTFQEVMRRAREVTVDAFAHQDVPFDRIVEELHPDRDAEENPLFQVAFAFLNTPATALALPGLTLTPFGAQTDATRFDLELHMRDADNRLGGVLYYAADLFEPSTVRRLLGHFSRLLEAVCEDAARPVSELPFLTDAERDQMLAWNDTTRAWEPASVLQMLDAQAARVPDAPAVMDEDGAYDYRALHAEADRLARWLRDQGVGRGARVGIWMARSRHAIVAILGTLKAGAAYVPLDPATPPVRAAFQLTDAGVAIVLTDTARVDAVPPGTYIACAADTAATPWSDANDSNASERDAEAASSSVAPPVTIDPADLAYVIYTSGSMGQPKGVMVTHGGVLNYLCWARATYPLSERQGTGTLFHSSLAFDLTVTSVLAPLVAGGCIRIVPDRAGIDDLTQAFRASRDLGFVKATPSHLHALAATLPAEELADRTRAFVVGGEALDAALVDLWLTRAPETRIFNEYGPTETVVGCCVQELAAGPRWTDPVPIGRAIANTRLYVVSPHGQLSPVGVAGELWIGGAGVARGYVDRPDLTADRFVPDPFTSEPGARAYRSGDGVRLRADGTFEYLGRLDHQVKVRGYRIELGEIEAVLTGHPAVREATVLADRDQHRGASLAAFIVVDADHVAREMPEWLNEAATAQVEQWQAVFDDTVRGTGASPETSSVNVPAAPDEPATNFAGWNSSYDDGAIPEGEMREWLDHTIERIRGIGAGRILEIGSGTGLLLFRLAPHCRQYVGMELSRQAASFVHDGLARAGERLAHVRVQHQPAHDFTGIDESAFDLVILNSVVQYFPTLDYLTRVLADAATRLAPGGSIFVGDVRSLPLLDTFHTSVQLHRVSPATRCDRLRDRIQARVAEEEELAIDPAFFADIHAHVPALAGADVLIKRDTGDNELAKFRYDVIIRTHASQADATNEVRLDWTADRVSIDAIEEHLRAGERSRVIVSGVPDSLTWRDTRAVDLLKQAERWETAADIRRRVTEQPPCPVRREDFWALDARHPGWRIDLSWTDSDARGTFTVAITSATTENAATDSPTVSSASGRAMRRYANHPMHRKVAGRVVALLQDYVARTLPDYMAPASMTVLPVLPLAASGKVDRAALLQLHALRTDERAAHTAPRTPTEELVAGIWSEVLGIERVGADDHFFELGGHSLLATQVVSRIRRTFGIELPLRTLFDAPTVAALSERIGAASASHADGVEAARSPLVPQSRGRAIPLSFAQQRLWFLHGLDPHGTAYHVPLALQVRGAFSLAALQHAFDDLVRRHEVLRTTFPLDGDAPVQRIEADARVPIGVVSLDALGAPDTPGGARLAAAKRLANEEARRPFDLARGPILRVTVLRLAADDHVILCTLHHIVSDAWSVGLLTRDLGEAYAACVQHGASAAPLPPLAVQYADFAIWQRRWLAGDVLERELDHWRGLLAEDVSAEDLFRRAPGVARPSRRRALETLAAGVELTQEIKRLAQSRHATLFMTLLAAWDVVLHAATGRASIIVSTEVANRRDAQVEALIGFFVNQLVLKVDMSGDPSFDDLLARARGVTLTAYDHQDLPFDRLVEALRPSRDAGRNPLSQVRFVLQNTPMPTLALPELAIQPFQIELRETSVDLMLTLMDGPNGLGGVLEYSLGLFDRLAAAALVSKFLLVLRECVKDPTVRLSTLSELLADVDRANQSTRQQSYTAALHRSLPGRRRTPAASVTQ